jgi:hypothetical protein
MTKLDELKLLTAWDVEPTLTEEELEDLLGAASKEDAAGLAPGDEDWEPTYDLDRAAARVWLVKAARASATVEAASEDTGTATSRVFENCLAMVRFYSAKRSGTVFTG